MQIITQTAPGSETDFEKDYIYNFILANAKDIESDGNIIVYSSNKREKIPHDVNKKDIVVHISNENLRYNYKFLNSSNIVLRSYYHPFIWKRNCYAIPLGWQSGFRNTDNIQHIDNKYMWCFIGQFKGWRKPMYKAFKDIKPNFVQLSEYWASEELTADEVKQVYLHSAFALVPFGSVHADTMRIMESLEYGCIPVVVEFLKADYYKYMFGDHPFILAKTWDEAREKVLELWSDKKALEAKQKEVADWYNQFKENLQADVTDILKGKRPKRCKQWKYQKWGRLNLKMLLIWYAYFYFIKRTIIS